MGATGVPRPWGSLTPALGVGLTTATGAWLAAVTADTARLGGAAGAATAAAMPMSFKSVTNAGGVPTCRTVGS
jgi:hypothetical protein